MSKKIMGVIVCSMAAAALAACGSSDDSGDSDSKITIVHAVSGQPGVESMPSLTALKELEKKYGYETKVVETPDTSILMEGVSKGEFQFGGGASAAAMLSIIKGGNMQIIASEANMQWVMEAKPGMKTCADLAGKRVGIHSAGSAGEGYFNYWASLNCTDKERKAYKIVYVAGSDARAAALLAGQLDAGMVTYSEVPLVDDKFDQMIDFKTVLDGKSFPNPLFVNKDFMKEHPEVVEQFLEEVVRAQQAMIDDEAVIDDHVKTFLPDLSAEERAETAKSAVDNGLFPADGGLATLKRIADVVAFMVEKSKELPAEAPDHVDSLTTDKYLEEALSKVTG